MQNLIVGVDGSEVSLRAARAALTLAKAFGARLTLLHVVAPIVLPGDAPWASLALLEKAEFERGQQVVHEVHRALGAEVDTEELVKVGPTADTIVEVASSLNDSMIVVGSTGKGAVKRVLLGSVADRVVHLSAAPVLVTR
jgi:nucleotide-binding universal stress UspA family protein